MKPDPRIFARTLAARIDHALAEGRRFPPEARAFWQTFGVREAFTVLVAEHIEDFKQ